MATTLKLFCTFVHKSGRLDEAEAFFRRALGKWEAQEGSDHDVSVAVVLVSLGVCVKEAGRPQKAEMFLKRNLELLKTKSGRKGLNYSTSLYWLGQCVLTGRRLGEAKAIFRQALEIEETQLGPDHLFVTISHGELGHCSLDAGRLNEAEKYINRVLLTSINCPLRAPSRR